jgi:hypothetical protein
VSPTETADQVPPKYKSESLQFKQTCSGEANGNIFLIIPSRIHSLKTASLLAEIKNPRRPEQEARMRSAKPRGFAHVCQSILFAQRCVLHFVSYLPL